MSKIYVVTNQIGLYLSKRNEWLDGSDNQLLYRTPHHDEALNTVFEQSSKDISLRAQILACDMDEKRNPVVEPADPSLVPVTEVAENSEEDQETADAEAEPLQAELPATS